MFDDEYLHKSVAEGSSHNDDAPFGVQVALGDDEVVEDVVDFDLNSFQIVRKEFFSHLNEPSITFCDYKVGLNTACIRRLPDTDYVQFLVNQETRTLAVRPCSEYDAHAFLWCNNSAGKRKPRQVTGKLFVMKICQMMDWNPDYRYKVLGKLIRANGQFLFVFDLTATEMYRREIKEGAKKRTSRVPLFPAEWQDQFGIPYSEHKKALQINIFENYAVYGIRDKEMPSHLIESPGAITVPDVISGGNE